MPPVPALPTGAGPGASWSKLLSVHNAAGDQEGEPQARQPRQGEQGNYPQRAASVAMAVIFTVLPFPDFFVFTLPEADTVAYFVLLLVH